MPATLETPSRITFRCEKCDEPTTVPGSLAGRAGRCGACRAVIRVPDRLRRPRKSRKARKAPSSKIRFRCTECSAPMSAPPEASGRKGRCGSCQAVNRVPGARVRSAQRPARAEKPQTHEKTCPGCGIPLRVADRDTCFKPGCVPASNAQTLAVALVCVVAGAVGVAAGGAVAFGFAKATGIAAMALWMIAAFCGLLGLAGVADLIAVICAVSAGTAVRPVAAQLLFAGLEGR